MTGRAMPRGITNLLQTSHKMILEALGWVSLIIMENTGAKMDRNSHQHLHALNDQFHVIMEMS